MVVTFRYERKNEPHMPIFELIDFHKFTFTSLTGYNEIAERFDGKLLSNYRFSCPSFERSRESFVSSGGERGKAMIQHDTRHDSKQHCLAFEITISNEVNTRSFFQSFFTNELNKLLLIDMENIFRSIFSLNMKNTILDRNIFTFDT